MSVALLQCSLVNQTIGSDIYMLVSIRSGKCIMHICVNPIIILCLRFQSRIVCQILFFFVLPGPNPEKKLFRGGAAIKVFFYNVHENCRLVVRHPA